MAIVRDGALLWSVWGPVAGADGGGVAGVGVVLVVSVASGPGVGVVRVYLCECGAVLDADAWDESGEADAVGVLVCPVCGQVESFTMEVVREPCEECNGTGIA